MCCTFCLQPMDITKVNLRRVNKDMSHACASLISCTHMCTHRSIITRLCCYL